MGVGHVTRCNVGRVGNETSGVSPGLSGRRDRFGTEPGMSHNREGVSDIKISLIAFATCIGSFLFLGHLLIFYQYLIPLCFSCFC